MSETFVLVHGAWHGGWCWTRVAEPLRARGCRVTTPTQTGLGERAHLLTEAVDLDTFITDVANHLDYEDLTEVVLVGHSFAGGVITGVADRRTERVKRLVYLDSLLLDSGETPFSTAPADAVASRREAAQETSGGLSIPAPPAAAFGVTDPEDVAWLEAKLTPHPLRTYDSALRVDGAPGAGLPLEYILCADPIYEPLESSRAKARARGWPVREIATGHDAMVTAPDALVEMLTTPG